MLQIGSCSVAEERTPLEYITPFALWYTYVNNYEYKRVVFWLGPSYCFLLLTLNKILVRTYLTLHSMAFSLINWYTCTLKNKLPAG